MEENRAAEIIVLSGVDAPSQTGEEFTTARIIRWIDEAFAQYKGNISPETFWSRCPTIDDELPSLGFLGWNLRRLQEIHAQSGITSFLRLKRVDFCPGGHTCFDFECTLESYLSEYGFSFDCIGTAVSFVTPRDSAIHSTYPAG